MGESMNEKRYRVAMDDDGDCWYVIEDTDAGNAAWEAWNADGYEADEPAEIERIDGPGAINFTDWRFRK